MLGLGNGGEQQRLLELKWSNWIVCWSKCWKIKSQLSLSITCINYCTFRASRIDWSLLSSSFLQLAPRPLWRLPPPASVASSPPSSRPQAVAPRPLWRLPPPASVAPSPPSFRPQAVAPRPLWRLPPPAFVASSPSYVVPVVPFVLEPGWLGYAWIFLRVMCFFVNFLTLTELTRFLCVFLQVEIEPSGLTNFDEVFFLFNFWLRFIWRDIFASLQLNY